MRARDNPLRAERIGALPFHFHAAETGLTWDDLLDRLAASSWRGAIIGPKGHGKSTLLEQLAPRLMERGFKVLALRLTSEAPTVSLETWRRLEGIGPETIVICDGCEQLARRDWLRLKKLSGRGTGLIISAHRAGLLPTILRCQTTPELLRELLAELLAGEVPWSDEYLADLHARHGGNLRDALRELYDEMAGAGEISSGTGKAGIS